MNENILNEILTTLKDFREENNKRWEENERRWKENDNRLNNIEGRLSNLEKTRELDKVELYRIVEIIDNNFTEIKEEIKGMKVEIKEIKKVQNQISERLDRTIKENEIRFKKIEAKQAKLEYLEKQQESIIYQQNIHTEQIEKILEKLAIQ